MSEPPQPPIASGDPVAAGLRQHEARFRAVVDALAEGVLVTDFERVLYVNPPLAELGGVAPDRLVGLPLDEALRLLPDVGDLGDRLSRPRAGESEPLEVMARRADGAAIWLRVHGAVVRDAAGAVAGTVTVFADLTPQRRAEQACAEAEARVRLLEGELKRAQEMESVVQLAGGVAHDFNNLLTTIGGFSDLLLQRLGPEDPARREVEGIRRAGERAAELTRRLLALSRRAP